MYKLLLKLILIVTLAQAGLTLKDLANCHSRPCIQKVEKASRDVLKIDWKPVSIWPEEAKKFK